MRGWLSTIRRAAADAQLLAGYRRLHSAIEFFNHLRVIDFDTAALERAQALRQQKIRIGTLDLRIAAITLVVEGVLITRNRVDFGRVPGLAIEDWSLEDH